MIMSNASLDSQHVLVIPFESQDKRDARATTNNPAAPEGYTDVYSRIVFRRNSFHCPGENSNITVQGSNVLWPNEAANSTDWVDIPQTTAAYTCTDLLFHWYRVKGVGKGQKVYVVSIDQRY